MNALKVGTPAPIRAGSSPIGSSCWPLTTAQSPKSIGDSPSVRERNSPSPRSSERAPASLIPVPGLLKVRTVVVPPRAAAVVSCRNRSGCPASGSRRWVCTSMTPGSTSMPPACMTRAPSSAKPGPTASIRPSRTATSPVCEPLAVTTVPPRITRSASSGPLADLDLLGALPEHPASDLAQPVEPALVGDERREVVARQRADSGAEAAGAVREEDLALADLAGIDQQVARCRVRGVVLVPDIGTFLAERDPGGLPTPLAMDEPRTDGEPRQECLPGQRRVRLPARGERRVPHPDLEISHA